MSLTRQLRDELAQRPPEPSGALRLAEAAGIVRFAGRLRLRGTDEGTLVDVEVRLRQASVARRLRASLLEELQVHPGLARQEPGNLRSSGSYLVQLGPEPLRALGVLDGDGRPRPLGRPDVGSDALVAGAIMAAGMLSGPGQSPRLEIPAPSEASAAVVEGLIDGATRVGPRVLVGAGDAVLALLARLGAEATGATFARAVRARRLRRAANRAVNADRANLARATAAAGEQIAAIERIVAGRAWEDLDDDLRAVALTRVANPSLSLADLGALLDPPVGKTTVHRRLRRLAAHAEMAEDAAKTPGASG